MDEELTFEQQILQNAQDAGMALPEGMKDLHACLRCGLLKTLKQFHDEGCENCRFLHMEDEGFRAKDATTMCYAGVLGVLQPRKSYVATVKRIGECVPGMYAVTVRGSLPEWAREECQHYGVYWVCQPFEDELAEMENAEEGDDYKGNGDVEHAAAAGEGAAAAAAHESSEDEDEAEAEAEAEAEEDDDDEEEDDDDDDDGDDDGDNVVGGAAAGGDDGDDDEDDGDEDDDV